MKWTLTFLELVRSWSRDWAGTVPSQIKVESVNWSAISTVTIARNKSKSICVEATTVMATLEKLLANEALCACSDGESFAIRSGGDQ